MIYRAAVSEFTSFQNIEVWNFIIMLAILSGALLMHKKGAFSRGFSLTRTKKRNILKKTKAFAVWG